MNAPPTSNSCFAARKPGGSWQTVYAGDPLGDGGEGAVFRDLHRPHVALKIYTTPSPLAQQKIETMLANPPSQTAESYKGIGEVVQIAWPLEILHDSRGSFCGFTMPRLDKSKAVLLNAWNNYPSRKRNNLPQRDLFRLVIASNLASLVAHVTKAGHSVVDFKPDNVFAYRDGGHVCLIDCDGFLIRGPNQVFPANVATLDFLAPEHHISYDPAQLGEPQGRFALAVLIFKLLHNGTHPTAGIAPDHIPDQVSERLKLNATFLNPSSGVQPPPGSHFPFLPDATQDLFRRALAGPPNGRPTPEEWSQQLAVVRSSAGQCSQNADHLDFGKGCPWCSSSPPLPRPKRPKPATTPVQPAPTSSPAAPPPPQPPAPQPGAPIFALPKLSPLPPPGYTLFPPGAVALSSLVPGLPFFGMTMISINQWRTASHLPAVLTFLFGLFLTAFMLRLLGEVPIFAWLMEPLYLYFYARALCKEEVQQHRRRGGPVWNIVHVAGVVVSVKVLLLIVLARFKDT